MPDQFTEELVGHRACLYGYAISFTRSVPDAEDLLQETFRKALSARRTFREGTSMMAWLYTIMRNTACMMYHKSKREWAPPQNWSDEAIEELLDSRYQEPAQETHLDLSRILSTLEGFLSPREIRLVIGSALGFKYADLGKELGIPEGTVKSGLSRALVKLKRRFPDFGPSSTQSPRR